MELNEAIKHAENGNIGALTEGGNLAELLGLLYELRGRRLVVPKWHPVKTDTPKLGKIVLAFDTAKSAYHIGRWCGRGNGQRLEDLQTGQSIKAASAWWRILADDPDVAFNDNASTTWPSYERD